MITDQQKKDMIYGLLYNNCTARDHHTISRLDIDKVAEYIFDNIDALAEIIGKKINLKSNPEDFTPEKEHIEPSTPWPKPNDIFKNLDKNKPMLHPVPPAPTLRESPEPNWRPEFDDFVIPNGAKPIICG